MKPFYIWIGIALVIMLVVLVYYQHQQQRKRDVQYMDEREIQFNNGNKHSSSIKKLESEKINANAIF